MSSSRALALLAGLASPVFLAAAIAGWLSGVWPANPVTLAVAAVAVAAGPLLGMWLVATADEGWEEEGASVEAPTVVLAPTPAPLALTPKAAAARAFINWRDTPHPVLEHRERERRAARHLRT